MCLILVCTSSRPSRKLIERAQDKNNDGNGIAYFEDGELKYKKGVKLTTDEILEITERVDFPFVIHFRKKTKGEVNDSMCHPFPISDDVPLESEGVADRLLFHNGTYTKWEDSLISMALNKEGVELPAGEWSDSRALAKIVHHCGVGILNLIDNRFAIISKENKNVKTFGKWWWYSYDVTQDMDVSDLEGDDLLDYGILFSNDYWKTTGVK